MAPYPGKFSGVLAALRAQGITPVVLGDTFTGEARDLAGFHAALARGKGELLNGCRLIYPMQEQAMRALNQLGNKFFDRIRFAAEASKLAQPIESALVT